MLKRNFSTSLLILLALLLPAPVMGTVVFDFDEVPLPSRKAPGGPLVEVYMEDLYGSNLSVSRNTSAAHGASIYNTLGLSNTYLQIGKGKGPSAIVISFDDNPIDSFSIDFNLFKKKAKSFSIRADGQLISMDILSKAQKKTGLSGQKTFFFDTPVHTLEFIGKKKSFAIDNLVVDLPTGEDTGEDAIIEASKTNPFEETELPSQTNDEDKIPDSSFILTDFRDPVSANLVAVPEPSSFLLLLFGFAAARLRSFYSNRR